MVKELKPTVQRPANTRLDYAEHEDVVDVPLETPVVKEEPVRKLICRGCDRRYRGKGKYLCKECQNKLDSGEDLAHFTRV